MLKLELTRKMKQDVKRMKKRGKDMSKLDTVLWLLILQKPLPPEYSDHKLKGKMSDFRECHIESDWLLIYQIFKDRLILLTVGRGTHSDLFEE